MDPTREGQTKRGTQRTSVKVDQGQKTGGRSDLTDVLAGPNAIAHRPYGPAPKQGTQGGGRPIDPAVLRKGWVDERAVSTPAVQGLSDQDRRSVGGSPDRGPRCGAVRGGRAGPRRDGGRH
jgi:hypothetical protein